MGANLFSSAWRAAPTNDELVHIPAGYYSLVRPDFRLNPEHPPLVKMWACLPLLVIRPKIFSPPDGVDEESARFTVVAALEFWQANQDRFKAITFWARAPMVLLTLGLGVLIFIYGRQLLGARAAVLSVALFSLEPTMLAHGWIVHTDVAAAFGYLLFLAALQAYYRAPTLSRALGFGCATGLALLTKFSLAILFPIFFFAVVYLVIRAHRFGAARRHIFVQACLASAVVLTLINAAYYFQHAAVARPEAKWLVQTAGTQLAADRVITLFNLLSRVLPPYYILGLYTIFAHNHAGHPASLLGQYSSFGWWYYFPVTFALKTSLPFLLLSVGAVCWALWTAVIRREKKLVPLLLGLAIYLALSMTSSINIGIRHLAPVFPFLFLLGGACLDRLLKATRGRAAAIAVVCLLGAMVVDVVRVYPNYLSFTNSLTFGKPAWALLSDSNVEWGQDVGELARYLHEHGEKDLVGSLSGAWASAPMYGIRVLDFAPPDLRSSSTPYVAIGAAFLNGSTVPADLSDASGVELSEEQRRNYFAKYRALTPEKVFGNSIYLYRKRE
ncbi:MAG: glycosyl transferase family 39 [Acidobacteria bacterium]|nr:glycosyl transferase family 39 [Acidobacteriota bacterium]